MILILNAAFSRAAHLTIMFSDAICMLKMEWPGQGYSPAEALNTVMVPCDFYFFAVHLMNGIQMPIICIVARTFILATLPYSSDRST